MTVGVKKFKKKLERNEIRNLFLRLNKNVLLAWEKKEEKTIEFWKKSFVFITFTIM